MFRDKLISSIICAFLLSFPTINSWAASAHWVGETLSGKSCTGGAQGYGPFDYTERFAQRKNLKIVEDFHFTSGVANLIQGKSGPIAADIDYTLRAWPNHHRALQSISQYHILHTTSKEKRYSRKTSSPVECYFQRAILFSPNDAITHMLYAIFLQKIDKLSLAAKQYEAALKISPDNRSIHYNYGLLLIDMKQYDKAVHHAKRAYAAGYPLPGLKKRLSRAGHSIDKPSKSPVTAKTQ